MKIHIHGYSKMVYSIIPKIKKSFVTSRKEGKRTWFEKSISLKLCFVNLRRTKLSKN